MANPAIKGTPAAQTTSRVGAGKKSSIYASVGKKTPRKKIRTGIFGPLTSRHFQVVGGIYQRGADKPLKTYRYSAETPEYFLENWTQGGTALLSAAFSATLTHMAEVVSEEVLMTTTSPSLKWKGYLLKAIAPTNRLCISCKFVTAKNYGFRNVKDLNPTFEWQNFVELYGKDPLDSNRELSPDDISYDLRLYHAQRIPISQKTLGTGTLAREYRNLPTNSFTVDDPLEHCTAYTWTVRARFNLAGKTYVTHWSGNFNEKQIEEFRRKQHQDSGAVGFNARGSGFFGSDQQYFYREDSYYFPFFIAEPGRECDLRPPRSISDG